MSNPIPQANIDELVVYILNYWIQNNNKAITGTIGQSVVWNLAEFIKKNPENWDRATIVSSDVNYETLDEDCIVIFNNDSSGELKFSGNIWNKYYFVNATDNVRDFSNSQFFYDIHGSAITSISARSSVYIALGEDGNWYQVNQVSSGVKGTSNISIKSSDFEEDGVTYINDLLVSDNVSIFWSDLANFIYQDAGQWEYVDGGGIKILIPGFNATTTSYHLELFLKQIN